MKQTLLDKIWDAHTVRVEDGGRCVLYIDRQYIHEVTSPVAFGGIERRGFGVARPAQITATADHNIRLRRQPHFDPRGAGCRGLRRGHLGGRDGLRQPVYPPDQTPVDAYHR